MSWSSKMTATQKAEMVFENMILDAITADLKFPLPRGAYRRQDRPEWYR